MAIAYDAFSNVAGGTGTLSWTHTPVGTPRGVLIYIISASSTDQVSSVTYGDVSMGEISSSPLIKTTGEVGAVHAFFLGGGIPTGAQTVIVNVSGSTTKRAGCYTVTAARPTFVNDTRTISFNSQANPSVILQLKTTNSFCSIGFLSGQDLVSGITPLIGWTGSLEDSVLSYTRGWYKYDTISSSDVAAGWTQLAEDAVCIAVAIAEDPNNCEISIYDLGILRDENQGAEPPEYYFIITLVNDVNVNDIIYGFERDPGDESMITLLIPFYNVNMIQFIIGTDIQEFIPDPLVYLLIPFYNVDVNNLSTVSENINVYIQFYNVDVNDLIYGIERDSGDESMITLLIPFYNINVNNLSTVSENIIFSKEYFIILDDTSYVSEDIQRLIPEYYIYLWEDVNKLEEVIYFSWNDLSINLIQLAIGTDIQEFIPDPLVYLLIPEYHINIYDLIIEIENINVYIQFYNVDVNDIIYGIERDPGDESMITLLIPFYNINVNDLIYGIERDPGDESMITLLIPFYNINVWEDVNKIEEVAWVSFGDFMIYVYEILPIKEDVNLLIPEYHVNIADTSELIEYIFILNTQLGNIFVWEDADKINEIITISVGLLSGYQNYVYSLMTLDYIETISLINIDEVIGV